MLSIEGQFDEVTEGIKLVGPAHESQAFPSGLTPAQQSVSQLRPFELCGEGRLRLENVAHLAMLQLILNFGSSP